MEPFLRSLSQAFTRNRDAGPKVAAAVAVLLALLLALQAAAALRGRRSRRARLLDLAALHGLGRDDLRFARALGGREGADPLALLTHLDLFERATARALAEDPRPADPWERGAPDLTAERIGRLRQAAAFDRLPPHAPLLSTRELPPGTAVSLDGRRGLISARGERAFALDLDGRLTPLPGETVALELIHAREARYALRCRVLATGAGPGPAATTRIALAHDESPERIQHRAYARVRVQGEPPIRLALEPGWPAARTGRGAVTAALLDVSGGGALIATRVELPVGALLRGSFAVGDRLFTGVRAVVLSSAPAPAPDGRRIVHLEFGALGEPERERLVAAVMELEREGSRGGR